MTENAKLTAFDGDEEHYFRTSVALSGNTGLVGAYGALVGSHFAQGEAYLFRGLDTATGTVTENAKLTSSDGAASDEFGVSVALSGNTGLVGASSANIGTNVDQGAAYLFRNLDTVTGTVTESVKLIASDGAADDYFGGSAAIKGDRFLVGTFGKNGLQGKAYTGSVRTFLTADLSNDATATDGLSFISQEDLIIGSSTSKKTVTLTSGDSGDVTASGKGLYVGSNPTSDSNTLTISNSSTLTDNFVQVGTVDTMGNELRVNGSLVLTSVLSDK